MAISPYKYLPLVPQKPEIRLATLYPGQFSDEIIISLNHYEFCENHKPIYEALSYVWGSKENQERVTIQDIKYAGGYSGMLRGPLITESLCCALRHLRSPYESRVLWVDAICIDQENHRERSDEVGRMGDIYASAEQVLVWLGLATCDSDLAIQMISSSSANIDLVGHRPRQPDVITQFDPEDVPGVENPKWTALKNFFQRPWFSRLWVRQEARLARKVLAILGHRQISWDNLEKAIRVVMIVSELQPTIWDFDEPHHIWSLFHNDKNNLYRLLQISGNTKFLDPRDIVYANLSMSYEMKNLNIQPDYKKPSVLVYRDLFFKHIQKYGILDIMLLCDLRDLSPGLPSFVPDFSVSKPYNYHISNYADGGTTQARNCKEASKLTLHGIQVTTVSKVKSRAPSSSSDVAGILRTCQNWEPDGLVNAPYCCGGTLLDAYCSTLTGCWGNTGRVKSASATESRNEFLTTMWSGRDLRLSNDVGVGWYIQNLMKNMRGCTFFETTEGYIGVTPADVKAGDRICVLLGGEAPFILRPMAESIELNQVVGPCYLHGVMFGEAILGVIEEPWVCHQDKKSDQWQFINQETGKSTFRDPRLWSLPSEWELHYCDDVCFCAGDCVKEDEEDFTQGWFHNKITKEETWYDPRLNVDGLKEHGVAIEEFILV